jgi:hypothetical protein
MRFFTSALLVIVLFAVSACGPIHTRHGHRHHDRDRDSITHFIQ